MEGQDAELPPQGVTGARLIGIVLVLLVLLVATLGAVEWINRGTEGTGEADTGVDAPP